MRFYKLTCFLYKCLSDKVTTRYETVQLLFYIKVSDDCLIKGLGMKQSVGIRK